jgi:hypothetical protein
MRAEEIAARVEIEAVLHRFCRGVDRGDVALIRSAFHADAIDDHGAFSGLAWDFAPKLVERLDAAAIPAQRHVTNVFVELTGDVAQVESYFLSFNPDTHPASGETVVTPVNGRYLDRFERRDGEWRIAARKVVVDWTAQGEAGRQRWWREGEFPIGGRREQDLSHALFAGVAGPAPRSIAGLGPVAQIAFVPDDMEAALRFWTGTIGAGPFYVNRASPLPGITLRGETVDIVIEVALGYWNDLQIELIRQVAGPPSIYTASDRLHHVLVIVDDIDAAREPCLASGLTLQMEGISKGAIRFAYFGGDSSRPMVELVERSAALGSYFGAVKGASVGWDGADPIRDIAQLNRL